MESELKIYNSLSRKVEKFEPVNPPFVGLYVCGPTVYGDGHLGHARAAITFDVVFRYLKYLGFKVRYVSNITDVGHLEDEENESGEDKIAKKARLEQIEPMEVVQYYTNRYHDALRQLNIIPPSIEPRASGHIIEQINMTQKILERGYAYEVDGSVYFDVVKYNQDHDYGKLSGRVLEELMDSGRSLEGQEEKRNKVDFALWKKAAPEHIMRWDSPWGQGFPGWHLECSVMSSKYLGTPFDIHGGGMDLKFPHHECEIAQSVAAEQKEPVKYWMHNNMITMGGQKMSKSLGNFITLDEMFSGNHKMLEQAYSPMTIRFFILQTHYRSTIDFSNEALQAAHRGYQRLMNAFDILEKMEHPGNDKAEDPAEDDKVNQWCEQCGQHLDDDFGTPQLIARLFDLSGRINSYRNGQLPLSQISAATFARLQQTFRDYVETILGLKQESAGSDDITEGLMQLLIDLRQQARANKDFDTSDKIRDQLAALKIQLKDGKDGTSWSKS